MTQTLDDRVDEWHDGDSPLPLHEYLGMTREQYAQWVAGPSKEKVADGDANDHGA